MPRTSVNYQNTIIYKIVCNDLNVKDLYVGHTTDFKRRKSQHKSNCINEKSNRYNLKIYQTIRQNGGWNDWKMIEIEKYPCNDSNEATSRERLWFETLEAKLNMIFPQRSKNEYVETNKDKLNLIKKKYREMNKDKMKYVQKQYRANNIEQAKEYKRLHYEKNKDKIKEQVAMYNLINKEKVTARQRQEIICECGVTYTRNHKARHQKSIKHIKFIDQQNI